MTTFIVDLNVLMLRFLIILSSLLMGLGFARATNYYTTGGGNGSYNNNPSWTPSAPPANIPAGDTVFILHDIDLSNNLDVYGAVIIESSGKLEGNKTIDVQADGYFINDGEVDITKVFTNNGQFINNALFNSTKKFINNNDFLNTGDFFIGRNFENSSTVNNSGSLNTEDKYLNFPSSNTNNTGSISADDHIENEASIINSGTIYTAKKFKNEPDASLINLNSVQSDDDFENDGSVTNSGIIDVDGDFDNNFIVQTNGNILVSEDFKNNGILQNSGNVTVSKDFTNDDSVSNSGNINVTEVYENNSSTTNSGNITADEVKDEGYTCNSGNISIDPGEKYECDGCTIDCGGLIIACEVEVKANSNISNQSFCCSDGSDPDFDFNTPYVFDSATIIICGVPLPIELLSFEASLEKNKSVLITWSTATEFNNDYFILEKSTDGVNWFTIKQIEGAGTSQTTIKYEHIDVDVNIGKTYYRLKQVDFNGEFDIYGPISIEFRVETNNLHIYPNPTASMISLSSSVEIETNAIQLYSIEGKNYTKLITFLNFNSNQITLDLTGIPKGIYLIEYRGNVHRIVKI